MALFSIAKVHPPNGFILLKRMPISEKLGRLRVFVDAHNNKAMLLSFSDIVKELEIFNTIRNDIAHGVYIGVNTLTGEFCFASTSEHFAGEGAAFIHTVRCFSDANLRQAVAEGEAIRAEIRSTFSVRTFHETFPSQFHAQKPQSQKAARKGSSAKSKPSP